MPSVPHSEVPHQRIVAVDNILGSEDNIEHVYPALSDLWTPIVRVRQFTDLATEYGAGTSRHSVCQSVIYGRDMLRDISPALISRRSSIFTSGPARLSPALP